MAINELNYSKITNNYGSKLNEYSGEVKYSNVVISPCAPRTAGGIRMTSMPSETTSLHDISGRGIISDDLLDEPCQRFGKMKLFQNSTSCRFFQKRYYVAFLAFLGNLISVLTHCDLSIAVIEMTSNKTITVGNETHIVNAEFNWTSMERGVILSAFPCGYIVSCLTAFVIYRLGGATSFGVGLAAQAVIEILSPVFLRTHLIIFLVARALQGLLEGFSHAGCVDILAHWAPPSERARLAILTATGFHCGFIIGNLLSGYVAYNFSWEAVFYTSGVIALIWSAIWLISVRNDPMEDNFITDAEKFYLANVIKDAPTKKSAIPWRSIFSSKPVYAIFNEYFTTAWTTSFLSVGFPLYVKDVLNVNTQEVGFITSISVLGTLIVQPIAGYIADYLRTNVYSVSKVHKIFIFWSQLFILICLMTTALCGSFVISAVCFGLIRLSFGVAMSSYVVIHIDLAGQYACVITAISMSCLSVGAILSPLTFGYMVPNHIQSEWNNYFLLLGFITMYTVIVFLICGSGETQAWAVPEDQDDADSQQNKNDAEN